MIQTTTPNASPTHTGLSPRTLNLIGRLPCQSYLSIQSCITTEQIDVPGGRWGGRRASGSDKEASSSKAHESVPIRRAHAHRSSLLLLCTFTAAVRPHQPRNRLICYSGNAFTCGHHTTQQQPSVDFISLSNTRAQQWITPDLATLAHAVLPARRRSAHPEACFVNLLKL